LASARYVKSELPVAMTVASANENEKKHSLRLFEKASLHVKPRKLLADPQYSSKGLSDAALKQGTLPVIPCPRNQMKEVESMPELTGNSESRIVRTQKGVQKTSGGGARVQLIQEPCVFNPA